MDMGVLEISGTGLDFQMARMKAVANNLANVGLSAARGQTYQPVTAVAEAHGSRFEQILGADGGVTLGGVIDYYYKPQESAPRRVYQPEHPDAGIDGYVEMPNINPVNEMLTMSEAVRAYEANVRVMNATKSMMSAATEIGRRR